MPTMAPWTPARLGLQALYDAELGQPKNVGYVQLDGTSGDYITTPHSPNVSLTGDIEVTARVYCNDWANGATQTLACKYVTTGNQRSWRVYVGSTGQIAFSVSPDGTSGSLVTTIITPTVSLVKATWVWLRIRIQLTNGSNSVGTLDTAPDTGSNSLVPLTWTANGSALSTTLSSIFVSTSPVEIGSFGAGTSERFSGRIGRVIVRDGLGGRIASDFNASNCYGPGYFNEGYLPGASTQSAYVPLRGLAGDYIWTADKAALRVTGDIEIVARVASSTWSSNENFVTRWGSPGAQAFAFQAISSSVRFFISTDGTNALGALATANHGFTAGTPYWVKVTRRASDGRVQFFTAPDSASEPSSWTQLGADVTLSAGSSIFAAAAPLELGSQQGGTVTRLSGGVFRAIVRSGIGGTTVADFNAANATAFGLPSDGVGNGWLIADPKHHGNWTLGLPKIYDRSGNGVAPATFGAGSNQPTWLPWRSAGVYLPGASGNYISCPDASALDITGDIDIVARVALADWTPSAPVTIVAKEQTVTQRSYRMQITTSGFISISFSIDGSASLGLAGSVAVPVLDGMTAWIRATRESASGRIRFYWYPDQEAEPTQWIQLGADANSTAGALFQSTSVLEIGSRIGGTTEVATGVMRRIIVRDGVGGTTVADFVAASCGQSGYTDTLGNVWTVTRATSGRKAVVQSPVAASARSVILHGTDDWIDVPAAAVPALDVAAAQSSVTASFRRWHNPGTQGHPIFTTKASLANVVLGFAMRLITAAADPTLAAFVGDGVNADGVQSGANSPALGARAVQSASVGGSAPIVAMLSNGALNATDPAQNTVSTTSTAAAGRIGAYLGGTGPIDMEFEALVCRDAAMADTEHGQLVAYYRGGT